MGNGSVRRWGAGRVSPKPHGSSLAHSFYPDTIAHAKTWLGKTGCEAGGGNYENSEVQGRARTCAIFCEFLPTH